MNRSPVIAVAAALALALTARADLGGKEPTPIAGRGAGLRKSRASTMQWLGVAIGEAPLEITARLPIAPDTGLVVSQVIAGSPAALAGLKPDDVLARLNDQILVTPKQLQTLVMHRKAGDVVEITFFRKGEKRKAVAVLMPRENM
jgi:serine protease Do